MTSDDDMMIRMAARSICANESANQDNDDYERYLSGEWDDTAFVRLTEEGIRRGIQIGRSL